MKGSVAQPPSGTESDDLVDRVRRTGQHAEDDDERETNDQSPPAADPTGNPAGDQHGDRRHHEVAREEQFDRAWRRIELLGQGRQDGVDQADAHEGDNAGQSNRPDGPRLAEWTHAGTLILAHDDPSTGGFVRLPAGRVSLLLVELEEVFESGGRGTKALSSSAGSLSIRSAKASAPARRRART